MKIIYIISAVAVLTFSCTKAKVSVMADPNCTDTISFAQKVKPIIDQNCSTSGCHDAGSQSAGYDFSTYSNVASNVSKILSTMRSESGYVPMPYGGPQLPDSIIGYINCWASQGALNN